MIKMNFGPCTTKARIRLMQVVHVISAYSGDDRNCKQDPSFFLKADKIYLFTSFPVIHLLAAVEWREIGGNVCSCALLSALKMSFVGFTCLFALAVLLPSKISPSRLITHPPPSCRVLHVAICSFRFFYRRINLWLADQCQLLTRRARGGFYSSISAADKSDPISLSRFLSVSTDLCVFSGSSSPRQR